MYSLGKKKKNNMTPPAQQGRRQMQNRPVAIGHLTYVTALKMHEKWALIPCKLRVFLQFCLVRLDQFMRFLQVHFQFFLITPIKWRFSSNPAWKTRYWAMPLLCLMGWQNGWASVMYQGPDSITLSGSEVNALVFPVPISHVNYPEGQLAPTHNTTAQGAVYTQHNTVMSFVFANAHIPSAQFVVSLENGVTVSLHFRVSPTVKGKMVHFLPQDVHTQAQLIKNTCKNKQQRMHAERTAIQDLFYQVYTQHTLSWPWKRILFLKLKKHIHNGRLGLYTHQVWEHTQSKQTLHGWYVCNAHHQPALLYFPTTYYAPHLRAIYMQKSRLKYKQCTYIWLLYSPAKAITPAFLLQPGRE